MTEQRKLPLLEPFSIFAILVVGMILLSRDDPFLLDIHPHPLWIAVLLCASRYGNPIGVIAGCVAAVVYCIGLVGQGVDILEVYTLHVEQILRPLLFLIVGWFIGETVQSERNRGRFFRERAETMRNHLSTAETRLDEVETAYRRLESRLAGDSESLLQFYSTVRKIGCSGSGEIWQELLTVLRESLGAEKVSVWLRQADRWVISAGETISSHLPSLGKIALEEKRSVSAREFFMSRDSDEKPEGLIAGLVVGEDGSTISIVVVESMPFDRFTRHAALVFDMILEWTSREYSRLRMMERATERDILDPSLGLASEVFFRTGAEKMCMQMERAGEASSFLTIRLPDGLSAKVLRRLLVVVAAVLRDRLRHSDSAAFFRHHQCFAVFLPGTKTSQAGVVTAKIEECVSMLDLKPSGVPLRLQQNTFSASSSTELKTCFANLTTQKGDAV